MDYDLALSEEMCISFVYQMKWPDGFRCPRCYHTEAYVIRTRRLPLYQCRSCRHQTSLTKGTIMEGSRLPLHKWVAALHYVASDAGVNAVKLTEIIGVAYHTAWTMLRSIREVIHQFDQEERLYHIVRMGIQYFGRENHQMFVRHPQEHPAVIGVELDEVTGEAAQVKIKQIPDKYLEGKSILPEGEQDFIYEHVSVVAYDVQFLKRLHQRQCPQIKEIFRQARRWLNRTFHGIGRTYLQTYLDEYAFRWNCRARCESTFIKLSTLCIKGPAFM